MRRFTLAIIFAACAGAQAGAQAAVEPAWTRVTYISGPAVYIDAGTARGVKEGTRLDVVRGGVTIAVLVAQFVSSTRASCLVERADGIPVLGDSVRFIPPARAVADPAALASGTAPRRPSGSGGGRIRGRIGVRYMTLDQGIGAQGTFSQPGVDIRLDGEQIAGTPIGIAVDIRTQRTIFGGMTADSTPAPVISVSRVYQAMLRWTPPGSRTQVSVGRQVPAALSTIGMFDGTAIDMDHDRWSVGLLAGTDPEPISMGLSQTTRRYGGYVQLHNAPAHTPLWTFTVGGVGAYDRGQIDREFGYFRATFTSPRFSLFAAQELDVNRGWKSSLEGSSTTPTSTFVIAHVTLADWLSLNGGADNRRNVRLYRDYQNPESAFDNAFRQGAWGGASLSFLNRVRLSSDLRRTSGGSAGDATSVTHSASVSRITPLQLGFHARSTAYTGTTSTGSLQSGSVELNPFGSARLELTLGRRESRHPGEAAPARVNWTGVDADIGLGRAVYLMLSASREAGMSERTSQLFVTLSYRF